jgi:ATP-dependent Clp protease protease subunit
MNYKNEFKKYATMHMGIPSTTVDSVIKHQIEGSVTPMIVEEREMRATIISVFDRLMMDRTLILNGVVDDRMSTTVNAQLLFLESLDRKRDIIMMIDSGGGSVKSGLTIYDTINYISPDVSTINTGMCASMASVLISSGAKGKRSSLIHSKIMTHMVSHGSQGNVQDTRINQMEAEKYNYILFKILAENSGKTFDEIFEISRNDKWFNSHESLQFGLIDEVIGVDKSTSIDSRLDGFEEYYMREVLKK